MKSPFLIRSAASSFGKLKAHFAEGHSSRAEVKPRPSGRSRYTPLFLRFAQDTSPKDTERSRSAVSPYRDPKPLDRGVGGLITPQDKILLRTIYRFAKKKKVNLYIVGGYLRDILLKDSRPNPDAEVCRGIGMPTYSASASRRDTAQSRYIRDIDFCLKRGAVSFGRGLARELKCGFVVLDKERGCCRLVKKVKEQAYTLDFTDFRGKDLRNDLLHRDFTINMLALELDKIFTKGLRGCAFIDPHGALRDLKAKTIRIIHKQVFDDDPLRILRAFSLAYVFDFKIDENTIRLIKLKRKALSAVSCERIRDELFRILDTPRAFGCISQMDGLGVLKLIFPEIEIMRNVGQGPYHHLDVWQHTLETIRQLEGLVRELGSKKDIQGYLDEVISSARRRRALIKLGALCHDIGKPSALRHEDGKTKFHGHERMGLEFTENIARRLRLSNDEINALKTMVLWHLRPGYLADNEEITPRARFRYFRDTANEGLSILLLSIADQRSTKGPLTCEGSRIQHEKVAFRLIKEYFKRKKEEKLPRLINGDDLQKKFKLPPSPLIGRVLREIEELQAIGKITGKSEALEAARRIINRSA